MGKYYTFEEVREKFGLSKRTVNLERNPLYRNYLRIGGKKIKIVGRKGNFFEKEKIDQVARNLVPHTDGLYGLSELLSLLNDATGEKRTSTEIHNNSAFYKAYSSRGGKLVRVHGQPRRVFYDPKIADEVLGAMRHERQAYYTTTEAAEILSVRASLIRQAITAQLKRDKPPSFRGVPAIKSEFFSRYLFLRGDIDSLKISMMQDLDYGKLRASPRSHLQTPYDLETIDGVTYATRERIMKEIAGACRIVGENFFYNALFTQHRGNPIRQLKKYGPLQVAYYDYDEAMRRFRPYMLGRPDKIPTETISNCMPFLEACDELGLSREYLLTYHTALGVTLHQDAEGQRNLWCDIDEVFKALDSPALSLLQFRQNALKVSSDVDEEEAEEV